MPRPLARILFPPGHLCCDRDGTSNSACESCMCERKKEQEKERMGEEGKEEEEYIRGGTKGESDALLRSSPTYALSMSPRCAP